MTSASLRAHHETTTNATSTLTSTQASDLFAVGDYIAIAVGNLEAAPNFTVTTGGTGTISLDRTSLTGGASGNANLRAPDTTNSQFGHVWLIKITAMSGTGQTITVTADTSAGSYSTGFRRFGIFVINANGITFNLTAARSGATNTTSSSATSTVSLTGSHKTAATMAFVVGFTSAAKSIGVDFDNDGDFTTTNSATGDTGDGGGTCTSPPSGNTGQVHFGYGFWDSTTGVPGGLDTQAAVQWNSSTGNKTVGIAYFVDATTATTDTDTATVADAAKTAATVADTEAITFADTAVLRPTLLLSDSDAFTLGEAATVTTPPITTPKTDTDALTLGDSATLAAAVSGVDASTVGSTAIVNAVEVAADAASLTDTPKVTATETDVDAATVADSATVVDTSGAFAGGAGGNYAAGGNTPAGRDVIDTDAVTVADVASPAITIAQAETVQVADRGALLASPADTEALAVAEALTLTAAVKAKDAATVADAEDLVANLKILFDTDGWSLAETSSVFHTTALDDVDGFTLDDTPATIGVVADDTDQATVDDLETIAVRFVPVAGYGIASARLAPMAVGVTSDR